MAGDNPNETDVEGIGALPKGTYYIVDRQSGGHLGWAHDLWGRHGWGTTDHTKWFMLWNAKTGDETFINGMRRGQFRIHPMGQLRLSEGCITVVSVHNFNKLANFLRKKGPDLPVPGTTSKAYGTVVVK